MGEKKEGGLERGGKGRSDSYTELERGEGQIKSPHARISRIQIVPFKKSEKGAWSSNGKVSKKKKKKVDKKK